MTDFLWTRALLRPAHLVCLLAGLGAGVAAWAIMRRLRTRHPEVHAAVRVRRPVWKVPRYNEEWMRLLWKGGHRTLDDPGLSARIRWLHGSLALMAAAVVVSLASLTLGSLEPSTPTLSRATTYITEPVLASGLPDYDAHLGGALPKEANLAPRAIEAVGKHQPEGDGKLTPWPEGEPFAKCMRNGAAPKALAQWMQNNAAAIDRLRAVEPGMHFFVAGSPLSRRDEPGIVDMFHVVKSLLCEALEQAHAGNSTAAQHTLRSVIRLGQALRTADHLFVVAIADAVFEAVASAIAAAPLW